MSAQKLLIANWKMWGTLENWQELAVSVSREITSQGVVIAPPMCALSTVSEILQGTPVALASQNVSKFDDKGHTGEVSAEMLKAFGAEYVLIGHSERRLFEGETEVDTALKVKEVLRRGMVPVLCIGETLAQKQKGETMNVLDEQLRAGVKDLKAEDIQSLVIAYEPVWGISNLAEGAPKVTEQDVQEAVTYIYNWCINTYGNDFAQKVSILYGGSVDDKNALFLSELKGLDGFLVGSSSLKSKIFVEIAHILGIK